MSVTDSPATLAGVNRASQFSSAVECLGNSQSRVDGQGVSDRIFGDIHDAADDLRSYAVSIREAAHRHDSITLRIHRVEFVRQAKLLAGLIRDIAPLEGEAPQ